MALPVIAAVALYREICTAFFPPGVSVQVLKLAADFTPIYARHINFSPNEAMFHHRIL